jgi:hypothetical protein
LHCGYVARTILAADLHFDCAVARFHPFDREGRHLFRRTERDRIAERYTISNLATQQLVNWDVERFAEDVPQGHLDTGFGLLHAVENAIHLLDEMGNARGILSDDGWNERLFQIVTQEFAAPFEDAVHLAEAGDASVRIDEHDRVVGNGRRAECRDRYAPIGPPARAPNWNCPHAGNLHKLSCHIG